VAIIDRGDRIAAKKNDSPISLSLNLRRAVPRLPVAQRRTSEIDCAGEQILHRKSACEQTPEEALPYWQHWV